MTTADAPYRRGSAFARGWRAFSRWRHGRPFWGGLLTIVSGFVYFYSGHISLGNIKISFSQQEFLGWMIPLILALCGILMLLTPGQRIFYGVLASAVSVGGLIGLNLGGFVVGMLLGIVGGALGASWTPVARPPVAPLPAGDAVPGPQPALAPEPAFQPQLVSEPEPASEPAFEPDPALQAESAFEPEPVFEPESAFEPESVFEPEPVAGFGEGAGRPGSPAHAAPDPEPAPPVWPRSSGPLADTLPASTVSPLGVPPRTTGTPRPRSAGPGIERPGSERSGMLRPGVERPDTEPSGGDDEPPPPDDGPLPRRSPRGLAMILVLLTVTAVGAATLRLQSPAGAAPSCSELFNSLIPSASAKPSAKPTGNTAAKSTGAPKAKQTGTTKAGTTTAAGTNQPAHGQTAAPPAPAAGTPTPGTSSAPSAPAGSGSGHGSLGGAVLGVLDGLGKLLGIGSDAPSSPSASATPTDSPTAAPQPTGTQPTGTPPTGTRPTPTPTAHSSFPAKGSPGAGSGTGTPGTPTGTPSGADCPIGSTNLVPPLDNTVVAKNPSEQITAFLLQISMTYRGVTELPTVAGPKVRVLEFTMSSSSSTPFELRVPMVSGNHTLSYKSTKLTVSGHVTFYTSRISGNLLGALPVTFTPERPPPLPPIPIPGLFFSNATLDLVLVHADVLTAPALDISYIS